MADGRLVIGTRRYSSWSMRGWLSVRLAGLDVTEDVIPLAQHDTAMRIGAVSPSGKVPYLEHWNVRVWDSLAIAEYCAEIEPSLWPSDPVARGLARSVSAEMHAGFQGLRAAMPMNLGREGRSLAHGTPDAAISDITRIDALWNEARDNFGGHGSYLFGREFGNADAAYAPVVSRFLSYGVLLSPAAQRYAEAVRAHPLVAEWYREAAAEPASWTTARYESVD
ncbi:glutathione S-transferase family protein [Acetobacter oeni]|uniref:Glutathione S-transferase n=1 Tax=Acetobacter oeni TaxID=304077 RepID=A0A511XFQ9_9PROT|nr:glutathione S-transferase family protein [Acetobacter oeni]NHO18043.1 glutathione S-transferase [Acetobacter oeni]GBR01088.1 glutathione S-transferase [Acetobacter oeni LMG 21952]GEN61790.1 glutathione S-transferase [Acetobacter oeni]